MAGDPQNFRPAWVRNLLIGSLALNVFLAGFVFARALAPGRSEPPAEPALFSLRALPPDMPVEVRDELEKNFDRVRPEVAREYRELVSARLKVKAILDDATFNPDELAAALDTVRELQIKIQVPLHEALIDSMKNLDVDSRRQFALRVDSLEGGGLWAPRHFDGTRWRVDLDNGKIILDLKTLGRPDENGNPEAEADE